MFRRFTKKRTMVALAVVASLVVAGGALAFFSSSGSGTGNATVGTSSALTFTSAPATGVMYPGSGASTFTYVVNNPSSGHQNLTATTATVASSGGNITQGGNPVSGCLASWFTAVNTAPTPLPQDLAGGTSSTQGSVSVTMSSPVGVNQDACKSATPDITLGAS